MTKGNTYRVAVFGSLMARDIARLEGLLTAVRRAAGPARPLEVVFDDFPAGAPLLAAQAAMTLGIQPRMVEPRNDDEALDPDALWSYYIGNNDVHLVILIGYDIPPPFEKTRQTIQPPTELLEYVEEEP